VAPQAPHKPWTPDTEYAHAPVPPWTGNPAVFETDHSDKPSWTQWGWTFDQVRPVRDNQLRALMSVDDMVRAIFHALDENAETNTLAVFTSDNGYLWGEHGIGLDKRFPYLPSMQVPFLARWPDHIAESATDDRLVANIDFLPTFLDAAGLSPQLVDPIDGHSFLGPYARSRLLLEYFKSPDSSLGPWSGDVTGTSEYIEWYQADGTTVKAREYYDLANDPWQLVNLLHDGDRSNDPKLKPSRLHLAIDRACSGSTCP
jgi:arylsulfatase A-like enzyme